jgi:hypothetical protein
MKRISTALAATGLLALGACGGGATNNVAAVNGSDTLYNVESDDLGGNYLGNESYGNDLGTGNAATGNGASNASSNAAGNTL